MVRELAEMVGVERLFDYADFGFVDDNWENRRIGGGRPQLIVFAEKAGWMRLLRRLHERHDVTVLALGGKPSLLTSEYTARHVRAAMTAAGLAGPVSLVGLVDWDPDGAIIAHAFAEQLAIFGVEVAQSELLIRPEHFSPEALQLLSRPTRPSASGQRWLRAGGGLDGQLAVLSAEAMPTERAEALVAQAVARVAPLRARVQVPRQQLQVSSWLGWVGGNEAQDAATLDTARLSPDALSAAQRANSGHRTILIAKGQPQAAVVPVKAAH